MRAQIARSSGREAMASGWFLITATPDVDAAVLAAPNCRCLHGGLCAIEGNAVKFIQGLMPSRSGDATFGDRDVA